jgi:hypothetical protein
LSSSRSTWVRQSTTGEVASSLTFPRRLSQCGTMNR